ncbi:hypothetical protein ASPCAL11809 [Aspergillus calidoustus]|uniref:C2H2-type domain-containing protein n=1 Tax=Aspergillus calidoustus TaxID=454130 RepID=A0A0U5GA15_ASPCI|nr:hypothetical protein ASPCAL11809 [Aspergillus calidoustus]
MKLQVDSSTPLDIAIDTVSESRLRNLFKSLCEMSSETRRLATERLLVDTSEIGEGTEGDGEKEKYDGNEAQREDVSQAESGPATRNLKRPISRYAPCENCEIEFDVTTNTSQGCIYHPEDAEPTEEMYEDIYEGDELFEIDSPEMRRDFPDRFLFHCCQKTFEENPRGCITDCHRAESPSLKKQRSRV